MRSKRIEVEKHQVDVPMPDGTIIRFEWTKTRKFK